MTHALEAEFTALVERQSRFVFRVAYAVLVNAYDAEDAVQETFLKLYRNDGWRGIENERAFLARVAWRVAVDLRMRITERHLRFNEPQAGADEVASPQPGPEQVMDRKNQHARIHTLIDALPEELRVPLVLSAFEEMNSRQIGDALSIPEGTVRTRLMRARQLLREKLTGLKESHYA